MKNKEQFIKEKMKKLVGEENYSRAQAYAIANSYWQKAQQGGEEKYDYAQQGITSFGNRFDPINMQFDPMGLSGLPLGNTIKKYSTQYGIDPMNVQQMLNQQQENTTNNYYDQNYPLFTTKNENKEGVYDYNNDGMIDDKDQMMSPTEGNTAGMVKKDTVYNNRVNLMNPYGSLSMDYALNFAGRGFGAKNPWQAGIGTGLSLIKGARNFLTGLAEGKEDLRVAKEMQDRQFDRQRNYVWSQQGGRVKNSDVIAQNAIIDEGQGNINMEMGEFVLRNSGQVQPVIGEPHIKNGKIADGVNATLNSGDKVISNYLKLKPADIKELKERYDISLKKGVTFAQAQKKVDQKIGIKKLEDEKATILEKIEKVKNIKDKTTQELSTNALLKSFATINEKINTLSGVREELADFIFTLQERQPKKDTSKLYDKNGKAVEETQDNIAQQGGETYIAQLAEKHNIPLERAMELMKMQQGGEQDDVIYQQGGKIPERYKNMGFTKVGQKKDSNRDGKKWMVLAKKGDNYKVVHGGATGMKDFSQHGSEERKERFWDRMGGRDSSKTKDPFSPLYWHKRFGTWQQGGMQSEQEEMQEGQMANLQEEQGEVNTQQLMQMVAQMLQQGATPEQVVQALVEQGVPQEVVIQAIQQVAGGQQQEQGGQDQQIMQVIAEALQSGAQPDEIMQEMVSSGVPEEQAMQAIQGVMQQMQGGEQQMAQQGGQKMYAQLGVFGNKMRERLNQNTQTNLNNYRLPLDYYASLVNTTQAEEVTTPQTSTETVVPQTATTQTNDPEYGLKAVQNYLAQWKDKPEYQYKDVEKTAERFKPFFDKYGVKYTDKDLQTMQGLDNLAGKLQETISKKYPELAEDYGINIEPTRKGLQKLLDKGIIKRGEYGVETDANGKVKIGSFNVLSPENQKGIKSLIDKLPENDKKEYAKANYVDYESYFRTLDAKEIEFKDKAEYDKYLEDNKDKKIGDYYKTDKVGAYIKPIYKPDTKVEEKPKEDYKGIDNPQTQTEYKDRVRNIIPNFEPYIPLFGSIQPIAKQSVAFPRLEPIKATIEPMLAEQERMRATEAQRVEQMGMTPQQQEAILAQGLASSQMAANDAISKTEQWNAQNQFATDQYNLGVTGKEQMMNNQYSADYQDKMMATLAALEESTRNQYRTQFLQGQSDRNYITNLNKFNTLSDQFAITDSGVEYLNNKGLPVQDYSFLNKKIADMTPEEVKMYTMFENMSAAKKRATS